MTDLEMIAELTTLTGDVPLSHRYYELVYAHLPRLLALARRSAELEAENARLRAMIGLPLESTSADHHG